MTEVMTVAGSLSGWARQELRESELEAADSGLARHVLSFEGQADVIRAYMAIGMGPLGTR